MEAINRAEDKFPSQFAPIPYSNCSNIHGEHSPTSRNTFLTTSVCESTERSHDALSAHSHGRIDQTDLGLSPGGRLRLTLTKSLQPCAELGSLGASRSESSRASFDYTISAAGVRAVAFSPEDPNRFIVSGTGESITHASRLGNSPLPRTFRSPRLPLRAGRLGPVTSEGIGAGVMCREERRGMGGISCLSFSSFFRRIFLAGCGDGSIRLYKVRWKCNRDQNMHCVCIEGAGIMREQ